MLPLKNLVRLLYNHNPFYLISAALVLYGLREAVSAPGGITVWTLLASLSGYTLLLALAAIVIVRLCKVWEDARTIVLTVVLLLLATSVGFDDIAFDAPRKGAWLLLVGLVLAIGISEALVYGLRLRLPWRFRLPYHLLLLLFFLYPILMAGLARQLDPTDKAPLALGLIGFPALASLLALSLLPAVRRGANYVANNGTPWGWPLYPWSLFVILAVCVCLRSYLFCVSFFPGHLAATPFGLYFLWPLILVVALILLEMGLVHQRPGLRGFALILPLLAFWSSFPGAFGQAADWRFVRLLEFSPIWLAAIAVLLFYGHAFLRGVREAEFGLLAMLAAVSLIGSDTLYASQLLIRPAGLPLLAIVVLQLCQLWRQPASWRATILLVALICAPATWFGGHWFGAMHHAIPANLLVAGMLMISVLFRDHFAGLLRKGGALGLAGLFVGGLALRHSANGWLLTPYLGLLLLMAAGLYWIWHQPLYFRVLIFNGGLALLHLGERASRTRCRGCCRSSGVRSASSWPSVSACSRAVCCGCRGRLPAHGVWVILRPLTSRTAWNLGRWVTVSQIPGPRIRT